MKFEVKLVYECDTGRDMSSIILKKKTLSFGAVVREFFAHRKSRETASVCYKQNWSLFYYQLTRIQCQLGP